MLNDEICKTREELNKSILNNVDYSVTYRISLKLDELIAKYYRRQMENENKSNNEKEKIK